MSVVGWFASKGPHGFGYNSTAADVAAGLDLQGKTYLLTGCNSGLGLETLSVLLAGGAHVVALARTEEKALGAIDGRTNATAIACELSEPSSVVRAVEEVRQLNVELDGIIANAGIMALPEVQRKHGLELQFLTNHVGHFLLVTGLLGQLAAEGRVVMVSSRAHLRTYPEGLRLDDFAAEKGYTPWGAYGQSKLSNLLFAAELNRRLPAGQMAASLHPGVIATNLTRSMGSMTQLGFKGLVAPLFCKSIPQGAATQVFLAVHPAGAEGAGLYYSDCQRKEPSAFGSSEALAGELWAKTESLVNELGV